MLSMRKNNSSQFANLGAKIVHTNMCNLCNSFPESFCCGQDTRMHLEMTCVCVCVRACVRAFVLACVRVCVRACMFFLLFRLVGMRLVTHLSPPSHHTAVQLVLRLLSSSICLCCWPSIKLSFSATVLALQSFSSSETSSSSQSSCFGGNHSSFIRTM